MKQLVFILTLCLVCVLLGSGLAFGAVIPGGEGKGLYEMPDLSGKNGKEILVEIDQQMEHLYEKPDFYIGGESESEYGDIRYEWLKYDFERVKEGYATSFLLSPVMYDPPNNDPQRYNSKDYRLSRNNSASPTDPLGKITVNYAGTGNKQVPAWGLDATGHWHIDWGNEEAYWFESGWSGFRFSGEYYNDSRKRDVLSWDKALRVLKEQDRQRHDYYYYNSPFKLTQSLPGLPDNILEKLIQEGVDYIWAGKTGYDVDFRSRKSGTAEYARRSYTLHNLGETPPGGWRDAVLIMLPPTYISWGRGVRFSADPGNRNIIYALDIPIAPISMVMYDLSASFINPLSEAKPGNLVALTVEAESTFDREIKTDYRWQIHGVAEEEVKFSYGSMSGEIALGKMEKKQLQISLIMPPSDVHVVFELNPADAEGNRKVQENGNYDNNAASHTVKANTAMLDNIPPWVLTKDVDFTLSSTATLTKHRGSWLDNAWGALAVLNGSLDVYNNFVVHNNPPVNEPPPTIRRYPRITATLDRADFGDDPKNGNFAPNNVPLSRTGRVDGYGTAYAEYYYTVRSSNGDGTYSTDTYYVTTDAPFSNIDDRRDYTFDVYNGIEKLSKKTITINNPPKKSPLKELDGGKNKEYKFNLAWEGTHYPMGLGNKSKVVRWMGHLDASGNVKEGKWEAVDGQYERVFIGQSEGTVTWRTTKTMKELYGPDRKAALERKSGKDNYKQAVFATDKQFEKVDWPIKSGYYFNPVGIYQCTVYTKQYKDTPNETDEHAELVEKVKEAFCYRSGLVYVNTSQQEKTIGDITAKDNKEHGLLTVEDKTPSHLKLIATLLPNTLNREGNINDLFKEVLEGYEKSGTEASNTKYGYRERTDQVIYEVKETTLITFTVAVPPDKKMYTAVQMKNGDYAVLAVVEEITFNFDPYLNLKAGDSGSHNGLMKMDKFTMDGIKVEVRGSMYDDRG